MLKYLKKRSCQVCFRKILIIQTLIQILWFVSYTDKRKEIYFTPFSSFTTVFLIRISLGTEDCDPIWNRIYTSVSFFVSLTYFFFQMWWNVILISVHEKKKKNGSGRVQVGHLFISFIIKNEDDWNPVPAFICSVMR